MDMDKANLYWTVFAALISAIWIGAGFIRDRRAQSVELSNTIMTRLLERDKQQIENPDIQEYISNSATWDEGYFRSKEALNNRLFFKVKAFVYSQLNSFDEILSISTKETFLGFIIKPAEVIEIGDWEAYIIETLRHPLYRSILDHEKHIFGGALRDFYSGNKKAIESKPADPYMW